MSLGEATGEDSSLTEGGEAGLVSKRGGTGAGGGELFDFDCGSEFFFGGHDGSPFFFGGHDGSPFFFGGHDGSPFFFFVVSTVGPKSAFTPAFGLSLGLDFCNDTDRLGATSSTSSSLIGDSVPTGESDRSAFFTGNLLNENGLRLPFFGSTNGRGVEKDSL